MFIVGAYYFSQAIGANPGLHSQALKRHLKEVLSLDPTQAATFMAFLLIPWMIKPLYGVISDFVPIFGSRRKSYFILASVFAGGSYFLLSRLGASEGMLRLLLFNAMVGFAFTDVLCDAVMVEKGRPLNATNRLQSAQWFAMGIGGLLVAFFKGYIAEYFSLFQAVQFSAIGAVLILALTFLGWKEEAAASARDLRKEALTGIKDALKLRSLWGCAIFIFLFGATPGMGEAIYYYQIDVLKFSDIQIGHLDAVASAAFVLGALFYGVISKKLSHNALLQVILASALVSNAFFFFYRDLFSAFVVTAFSGFISVLNFLGILTLAAKVCPKRVEGTVFALLMSISNAGMQLSNIAGAKIYESAGYHWTIMVSVIGTAALWLLLPLVKEKKLLKGA